MTFPAILAKFTLVYILVAICTVCEWDPGKLLKFSFTCYFYFVAFLTINLHMHANKRKLCGCMIKMKSRSKVIHSMALPAISGELFPMIVIMTGKALGI